MYTLIFVDLVKRGVLTFVGEIRCHKNDRYYHEHYYYYQSVKKLLFIYFKRERERERERDQ